MEISSIIQRHMFYALSEMKYAKDKSQNNPGEVEIDAKTFLSIPDHRAFLWGWGWVGGRTEFEFRAKGLQSKCSTA
jgi:hypothetical protein